MTATPCTQGSAPMLRSCLAACASIVYGSVQTRTGARVPASGVKPIVVSSCRGVFERLAGFEPAIFTMAR